MQRKSKVKGYDLENCPWVVSIPQAAEISGIGTYRLYKIVKQPGCPFVVHVGTRNVMINTRKLRKYLDQNDVQLIK